MLASRVWRVLLAVLVTVPLSMACHVEEARKPIGVLRVGSISFPYPLIEQTRAIAEVSGKVELVSAKEESTGHTRLDQFITQPGLFEEWRREHLPKIQAGKYDFVIIPTIVRRASPGSEHYNGVACGSKARWVPTGLVEHLPGGACDVRPKTLGRSHGPLDPGDHGALVHCPYGAGLGA